MLTTQTKINFSIFSSAADGVPKNVSLSLEEFLAKLSGPPELVKGVTETNANEFKVRSEAWCPATFRNGRRLKENVESVCALVLDFDKGLDGEEGLSEDEYQLVVDYIEALNVCYVQHDSFRSGFFAPKSKFRIVLPLLTPVSGEQYEALWDHFNEKLPVKPDKSRRGAWGIFFTPSIPEQFSEEYCAHASRLDRFLDVSVSKGQGFFSGLNEATLTPGRTEAQWLEAIRVAEFKDDTLKSAVPGIVRRRLESGKSTDVWPEVKAALENNSNPVKDWGHAEDLCKRQTAWQLQKWAQETHEGDPISEVESFKPTEKQLKKAHNAVKDWCKKLKADPSIPRLREVASFVGRYTPHVLSPEYVADALALAVKDAPKNYIIPSLSEEPIRLGLLEGSANPYFLTAETKGWKGKLLLDKEGYPLSCDENVFHILRNHPNMQGVLRHDVRLDKPVVAVPPPWHSNADMWPHEFEEHESPNVAAWVSKMLENKSATHKRALECVISAARADSFDPFEEWLETLTWDGINRLDTWLVKYGSVEDNEYVRMISSKFLISAVARAYNPNTPADCAVVLMGEQGVGKSRLLAAVVPEERYYLDNLGDIKDKDTLLKLQRFVIVEIAELTSLNKKEANENKSFISSRYASVRAAYGRLHTDIKRRAVLAGTTNEFDFIRDPTGGRRYWPVEVKACDPAGFVLVRDQVWAEAVHRFKKGEPCWLDREQEKLCASFQDEARFVDELEGHMLAVLEHPVTKHTAVTTELTDNTELALYEGQKDEVTGLLKWVTAKQICTIVGLKPTDMGDVKRAAAMLTSCGYRKMKQFRAGRFHVRPYSL